MTYQEMSEEQLSEIFQEKRMVAELFKSKLTEMLEEVLMSYRNTHNPKDLMLLHMINNRIESIFTLFNYDLASVCSILKDKELSHFGYTIQWKKPPAFYDYFGIDK